MSNESNNAPAPIRCTAVIDISCDDEELREQITQAIEGTLNKTRRALGTGTESTRLVITYREGDLVASVPEAKEKAKEPSSDRPTDTRQGSFLGSK